MNILVLGASGMIGSYIYKHLKNKKHKVTGTYFSKFNIRSKFYSLQKLNCLNINEVDDFLGNSNAEVIINCTGITKHTVSLKNEKLIFKLNAELPQYLAKNCIIKNKKLIQISTDCVFDGLKGDYSEKDKPNAKDIYGISKAKGEIIDEQNLTLRTSTIGHEIETKNGLLEWFLDQDYQIKGYSNAIFNGLTTNYLAKIINDFALNKSMNGLYNISNSKISKYHLLKIINKVYNKRINIIKDEKLIIDRSLNNSKFFNFSKHNFPSWEKMINDMYENK